MPEDPLTKVVRARFKLATNRETRLVLCGKPDRKGNKTCPGVFGIQPEHDPPERPPMMRIYGIFRRDVRGVYQPTIRTRDQRAESKPVKLRKSHVLVHGEYPPRLYGPLPPVDYGPRGEQAGEIVYDFPLMALCPQCLTSNEIHHFSE